MKDLKPDEAVDLMEMLVPIGNPYLNFDWQVESPDESAPGAEEEAPPPEAFQYYDWDE